MPLDPIAELGARAKAASRVLATASTEVKDAALLAAADLLLDRHAEILAANADDVAAAEADGRPPTVVDRLRLSDMPGCWRWPTGCARSRRCPIPVGEVADGWTRPNGLRVQRVRVPLGVVAIIYENRPNVTSDAFGLCLKAGNAAFLRGSSGAIRSNIAIAAALREGLAKAGLPHDSLVLVEDTRHEAAVEFMRLRDSIDVLIPRGGPSLIRSVLDNATVPVRHRRRRQLPRVRRRQRRPVDGGRHRRERQDPAALGVQRGGDAARPPQRRRHLPHATSPRGSRASSWWATTPPARSSATGSPPSPPTTTTPRSSST